MEGLSKFRECWGRVAAGHLGARHASPPSFPVALNLSWPWGYRDSIFLLGMALLFSDGLCLLFPGVVVLSSSFLSCPSHPEGRVVITGLLCLWWAGQRPCLQGGWAPIPPLPHFSASQGLPCSWGSTLVSGTGCVGVTMPQWAASLHGGGSWCSYLPASFQPPVSPSSTSLAAVWRPLFTFLAMDR